MMKVTDTVDVPSFNYMGAKQTPKGKDWHGENVAEDRHNDQKSLNKQGKELHRAPTTD